MVRPHERLGGEHALRVYTLGRTWFSFDEKVKGSIESGKLADLVVLSDDYLTVPEDKIREISSVMTIVGGNMCMREASEREKSAKSHPFAARVFADEIRDARYVGRARSGFLLRSIAARSIASPRSVLAPDDGTDISAV